VAVARHQALELPRQPSREIAVTARVRIRWNTNDLLEAREVPPEPLRPHAAQLAEWYDESHNAAMMSNTQRHTPDDVVESFASRVGSGDRQFLLFADGALAGDADFRHVAEREAEFAIMIGARATQGKGLGTRFSVMLHAFAFRVLGLEVVYLAIVPANVAGRRCYEKVGYVEDPSCPASRYAEEPTDVTMSLTRAAFEELHGAALDAIAIEPLPES
jgi:RimJ/RimL family protein N-acetyltransferase